ncbi:hypothetical protein RvY_05895-2 [Ramazzottius varieornatus]|uniref:Beta-glucuronidase n=1 Tax=Ramazzottius varieornatus TaxID=947166 RepID=A0A1D1V261_RAMVA|nr:hypothetical protein RvY_05895-2 [Ramazzottius varieornatus]
MYTMAFSAANVFLLLLIAGLSKSLMRPQENELREMKCLDGLWSFRYSPINFTEKAPEEDWSHRSVQNVSGAMK